MAVSPDRLRGLPLFSSLSDDALDAAARLFAERQVKSGTCLTVEGVRLLLLRDRGRVVEVEQGGELVNTLVAGDYFGEMAIITGERRSATAKAASTVDLLVLFGTDFRVLECDVPSVAQAIVKTMDERVAPAVSAD